MRIWENRALFSGSSSPGTWAFSVFRNVALGELRRRKARGWGLHNQIAYDLPVVDSTERAILAREVLHLAPASYRGELIAFMRSEAIQTNTAKIRRFRAIQGIRERLERKAA